nr:hypothetical protein [uncultured Marinifilum sp.]
MNKNSVLITMFEEIKRQISIIEKRFEQELKTNVPTENPIEKIKKRKEITAEDFISMVHKTIVHSTQKELEQTLPKFQDFNKELLSNINDLQAKLRTLKCYPKERKKAPISNFKILKIVSIIVVSLLLFSALVLKFENSRLKDNDLKFRYIYSNNGIDSTQLKNLETIFHINRDKEFIKSIRKNVEESELKAKMDL